MSVTPSPQDMVRTPHPEVCARPQHAMELEVLCGTVGKLVPVRLIPAVMTAVPSFFFF